MELSSSCFFIFNNNTIDALHSFLVRKSPLFKLATKLGAIYPQEVEQKFKGEGSEEN